MPVPRSSKRRVACAPDDARAVARLLNDACLSAFVDEGGVSVLTSEDIESSSLETALPKGHRLPSVQKARKSDVTAWLRRN
ncbi:MAG: hypothetical protein ACYDCK_00525 [Thermoplasmatota archaeon]